MINKGKFLLVYFLTLIGIISWLGLIFLAPYLKSRSSGLNIFIYAIFSPICHQIPSRCLTFFGYPLAVCARCLGIYFGFLGGTGLFPFLGSFSNPALPKNRTLICLTLPIAADALGNFFHLWRSSNWVRFATGFIWGTILAFYFIIGLADCFARVKQSSLSE
jgi:uncharacterized membrane protein